MVSIFARLIAFVIILALAAAKTKMGPTGGYREDNVKWELQGFSTITEIVVCNTTFVHGISIRDNMKFASVGSFDICHQSLVYTLFDEKHPLTMVYGCLDEENRITALGFGVNNTIYTPAGSHGCTYDNAFFEFGVSDDYRINGFFGAKIREGNADIISKIGIYYGRA